MGSPGLQDLVLEAQLFNMFLKKYVLRMHVKCVFFFFGSSRLHYEKTNRYWAFTFYSKSGHFHFFHAILSSHTHLNITYFPPIPHCTHTVISCRDNSHFTEGFQFTSKKKNCIKVVTIEIADKNVPNCTVAELCPGLFSLLKVFGKARCTKN